MMELLFENSLGLKADRNVDTKLNGGWIQLLTPPPPLPLPHPNICDGVSL